MEPGKVTRATSGDSIPQRERQLSESRCHLEQAYRGSNPTAAISSFAEAEAAARSVPCVDRGAAQQPRLVRTLLLVPGKLTQRFADPRHHAAPFPALALPKQPRARVPGAVVPLE